MMRAAAGSARIKVVPSRGSWRRVASLQWSDLDWEMMTRSGVGSCVSEVMQAGCFWRVKENLECRILEDPVIQGSRRIWKEGAGGKEEGGLMGVNITWKEASVFRCLIVKAMASSPRRGDLERYLDNEEIEMNLSLIDIPKFPRSVEEGEFPLGMDREKAEDYSSQ